MHTAVFISLRARCTVFLARSVVKGHGLPGTALFIEAIWGTTRNLLSSNVLLTSGSVWGMIRSRPRLRSHQHYTHTIKN